MRIVSLVPSLTELLCTLGLREQLVGRTGFCIHPRESLREVVKVGGTKAVDVERVRALRPTHLVVNVDENEKPTVDRIAEFVPNVVVTHPLTVDDNVALIERFGEVFERRAAARALVERQHEARSALRARGFAPLPVLYLIWRKPWMSIGRETFIAAMLAEAGMRSVIESGEPRYPVIDDPALDDLGARVVLLSSEPFRFTARHRDALLGELAARDGGVAAARPLVECIDGEMTSWYGGRAIDGLDYLREFRQRLDRSLESHPAEKKK